jgi:Ca2+-binding EF-hand superfamily protein
MKTSRIVLLAGAALAATGVVAVAVPAFAQMGPGYHHHGRGGGFAAGEAFARADANNDGRVTLEEGRAWLAARFTDIDTNRDGGVTSEEMRAYAQSRMGGRTPPAEMQGRMEQRGQAMFRALDANADGRVTLEEVRPFAEAMFRARDLNNDGALTRDEVMRRRGEMRGDRGPGMGMGPGGERRGPPAQAPAQQ